MVLHSTVDALWNIATSEFTFSILLWYQPYSLLWAVSCYRSIIFELDVLMSSSILGAVPSAAFPQNLFLSLMNMGLLRKSFSWTKAIYDCIVKVESLEQNSRWFLSTLHAAPQAGWLCSFEAGVVPKSCWSSLLIHYLSNCSSSINLPYNSIHLGLIKNPAFLTSKVRFVRNINYTLVKEETIKLKSQFRLQRCRRSKDPSESVRFLCSHAPLVMLTKVLKIICSYPDSIEECNSAGDIYCCWKLRFAGIIYCHYQNSLHHNQSISCPWNISRLTSHISMRGSQLSTPVKIPGICFHLMLSMRLIICPIQKSILSVCDLKYSNRSARKALVRAHTLNTLVYSLTQHSALVIIGICMIDFIWGVFHTRLACDTQSPGSSESVSLIIQGYMEL